MKPHPIIFTDVLGRRRRLEPGIPGVTYQCPFCRRDMAGIPSTGCPNPKCVAHPGFSVEEAQKQAAKEAGGKRSNPWRSYWNPVTGEREPKLNPRSVGKLISLSGPRLRLKKTEAEADLRLLKKRAGCLGGGILTHVREHILSMSMSVSIKSPAQIAFENAKETYVAVAFYVWPLYQEMPEGAQRASRKEAAEYGVVVPRNVSVVPV